MWQVAVLYSVVLFSMTLADCPPCNSDGPDNCPFVSSLSPCKWTLDSTVWNFDTLKGTNCAVFSGTPPGINVTSRRACSTGNKTHCLQIRYLFENTHTGIKVIIDVHDSGEQVVWNGTDPAVDVWHANNIPIQSKGNFTILLEVRQFTEDHGRTLIDYIKYVKTPCTVQDSPNDEGVVVGVVVAVIVIVVAVIIFILYRRKKLYLCKTCFINKDEKDTSGTSVNGERSFGKHDRRAVNSFNTTPTVSGINNRAVTASEAHPSDTYYSVIKDTDGSGNSAAPHYCTIQESQNVDGKTLPSSSKCRPTNDDPYKIKSATTRKANANVNVKVRAGLNGNHLPPASNGGNRQAPSDCSLATDTGGEAAGVYHCLEEDPHNHGEGGDTGLYHYAKDPDMNPEASADATGVYHILEEDPANPRDSQLVNVHSVHHDGQMGHQQTPAAKASKGHTGNYNTLEFSGNNSGQKTDADASGGVYNHLNAGSDDPYNEVDREKRAEVIDGEYSHIK